jgi:LacI family transcriptional regulator
MKRPTQVDVARVAGVSRATVSYVLNGQTDGRVPISGETRQRVLRAIAELGYEPDARAQSLRSGGTRTIGLIIPNIRNPHFWEFAEGVEREARGQNYLLLLSNAALNFEGARLPVLRGAGDYHAAGHPAGNPYVHPDNAKQPL